MAIKVAHEFVPNWLATWPPDVDRVRTFTAPGYTHMRHPGTTVPDRPERH